MRLRMIRHFELLCVVAGQRSGTTALRSSLETTGEFLDLGEIFHTDDLREASFLTYVRQHKIQIDDFADTDRANVIADEYIAFIHKIANPRIPIIDIKFNSWNAFSPIWGYLHETPFFMRALFRDKARFLFVYRRDIVGQVLSEQVAREAQVWHDLKREHVRGPIVVDSDLVPKQAALIMRAEKILWNYLTPSRRAISMHYESLFKNRRVNDWLIEQLSKDFQIRIFHEVVSPIGKNEGDIKDLISNYGEIQDMINEHIRSVGRIEIPDLYNPED